MAPTPRRTIKPTFRQKIKTGTKTLGKKAALVALGVTLSTGAGYNLVNLAKPVNYNISTKMAHGNNLSTIDNVGTRLSELNNNKENRNKGIIYGFDGKEIKKVRVDPQKVEKILLEQRKNYELMETQITEKINNFNRDARVGEIYFWNGQKISRIVLDPVKAGNIYKRLSPETELKIESIIDNIVKSRTENKNEDIRNEFYTKVVNRMRKADKEHFREYFATLPLDKFAEEIKRYNPDQVIEINKLIKEINPEVLDLIQKDAKVNSIIIGSVTGALSLFNFFVVYGWGKKLFSKNANKKI
ncbi:MAG: hypothetical protein WCX82_00285 [archaeon]|jgi:hypothetical protein